MESEFMKSALIFVAFALFSSGALSQDLFASNGLVGRSISLSDSMHMVAEHFNDLAQEWMHAYNNNDSTTLAALYSPDADYISSHVQGLVAHGRVTRQITPRSLLVIGTGAHTFEQVSVGWNFGVIYGIRSTPCV
jgi:hypothetical protein